MCVYKTRGKIVMAKYLIACFNIKNDSISSNQLVGKVRNRTQKKTAMWKRKNINKREEIEPCFKEW